MLSYRLLNNHAGLLLIGDYTSLRWLHEVIHEINDRSPLIRVDDGPFLGLAYEVRKAYEQQREIIPAPEHFEEVGTRYGTKLLWPVLLLQQRMMRVSLAYLDHSAKHQAITYALEAVIEEALIEDFGPHNRVVIDHWQQIDPASPDVLDKLDSRGGIFCSWTKSERKYRIAALLASFDRRFEDNHLAEVARGESPVLSPEELRMWEQAEWPDPNW